MLFIPGMKLRLCSILYSFLSFQILHFMIFILRYLVGSKSWLLALSCLCHFWRRKLSIERNMQRKYYSESLQVRAEKNFSFFTVLFLILWANNIIFFSLFKVHIQQAFSFHSISEKWALSCWNWSFTV